MLSLSDITLLTKEAIQSFTKDNAMRLAAALTFYTIFALTPLLILAIAVVSELLSYPNVQEKLVYFLAHNVDETIAKQIRQMLESQKIDFSKGISSTLLVGLSTLAWAATNLFVQLQSSLNEMWKVKPEDTGGFIGQLKTRGFGLLMVLGFGIAIIGFFALNTYISSVNMQLPSKFSNFLIRFSTFLLTSLFLTGILSILYKTLPNVKLKWSDVILGSSITALLFSLLQILTSWYFTKYAPTSAFGATSSLVLLLLWINYNSIVFFFGAELTFAYAKYFGSAEAHKSTQIKEHNFISNEEAKAIIYASQANIKLTPTELDHLKNTKINPSISLKSALWNAFVALMALPAIILIKISTFFTKNKPK